MSLAIDLDEVTAVLLPDGWHTVNNQSFTTDAYEYVHGDHLIVGGGQVAGVPSTGFAFQDADTGTWIVGPLTSIHAITR